MEGVLLWELVIQGFEVQYSTFFCLSNSLNVDLSGILLYLCFWILCLTISTLCDCSFGVSGLNIM
jgi:hypothetical protein